MARRNSVLLRGLRPSYSNLGETLFLGSKVGQLCGPLVCALLFLQAVQLSGSVALVAVKIVNGLCLDVHRMLGNSLQPSLHELPNLLLFLRGLRSQNAFTQVDVRLGTHFVQTLIQMRFEKFKFALTELLHLRHPLDLVVVPRVGRVFSCPFLLVHKYLTQKGLIGEFGTECRARLLLLEIQIGVPRLLGLHNLLRSHDVERQVSRLGLVERSDPIAALDARPALRPRLLKLGLPLCHAFLGVVTFDLFFLCALSGDLTYFLRRVVHLLLQLLTLYLKVGATL